jgi:exosortase
LTRAAAPIARSLALVAVAALYVPTLAAMADAWRVDSYAGHGMFVPLFSALLVWFDRERIRARAGSGHPAGALMILAALGVLGLGYSGESLLVRGVSLVMAVAGAVLWIWGAGCLRATAFPVAFLVFMVPLPRAVVGAVTLDLQLFAASFAAGALRLMGIPVYRTGAVIELPSMTLEVAEICNGLRFLLALVVLTAAFAQVSQRTVARKILLVSAAIPVAILANAIRVATIGLGVQYIGPEAASGVVHHTIGKVVWALTVIPLIALGFGLGRRSTPERGRARAAASLPVKKNVEMV